MGRGGCGGKEGKTERERGRLHREGERTENKSAPTHTHTVLKSGVEGIEYEGEREKGRKREREKVQVYCYRSRKSEKRFVAVFPSFEFI